MRLFLRLPAWLIRKAAQRGWVKPGHKYVRRWWDSGANRWRYEYYEAEKPDHHHDADAVVVGLPGGRVGVATEYDPKVKDKLKSFGGRWDPERKVWTFDSKTYLEKVRPYLRQAVYDLEAIQTLKPHLEPDSLPAEAEPPAEVGETATHYADGWPKSVHMINARQRFGLYEDQTPAPFHLEAPIRILASVMRVRNGDLYDHRQPRGFFLQGKTLADRLSAFAVAGDEFLAGNGRRGQHLGRIVSPNSTFVDGVLVLVKTPQRAQRARGIVGDRKVVTNSEEPRGYLVLTPEDLEAALQDPERRTEVLKHLGMVYVDGSPQEWEDVPALKRFVENVGVVFFGVPDSPQPEMLAGELAETLRMPEHLGWKKGGELQGVYQDPGLRDRFARDLVRAGALIEAPEWRRNPRDGEKEAEAPVPPPATKPTPKPASSTPSTPMQPGLWEDVPPKPVAGRKGKPSTPPKQVYQPPLFELAKALGYRPGMRLVLKAEVRNIPVGRLKWVDRPKEREKVPATHYLLPKERKFPYRNKDGSINCRLLRAAISRAAQHGYKEVEEKARRLYQKHCGKEE